MPRVGRSSDSRAIRKAAFSPLSVVAIFASAKCDSLGNGFKECLRFLGYSGGAVPDSHRVPCFVGGPKRLTDHQRTLTAGNVPRPNPLVKRCEKISLGNRGRGEITGHFRRQLPNVAAVAIGEVEPRIGALERIAVGPKRVKRGIRIHRSARIRVI
jgi:hypothetical protein